MRGCLFALILLTGCQSNVHNLYSEGFPGTASWYITPFANFSTDKHAGPLVERVLVSQLRSAGVENPIMYRNADFSTLSKVEADNRHDFRQYKGTGFTVGGKIHSWTTDEQGHPLIFLSLYVRDSRSGKKLWSIRGFRKGEANEPDYKLCEDLIAELLSSLRVNRKQK